MPQVNVTIAGKSYRMACGDGEEPHLERLAAFLDGKIDEMRQAFGEIGEMRLHVMAALTAVDDLFETRSRLAALEAEVADLRGLVAEADSRAEAANERFARAVAQAAERVERLSRTLNGAAASED